MVQSDRHVQRRFTGFPVIFATSSKLPKTNFSPMKQNAPTRIREKVYVVGAGFSGTWLSSDEESVDRGLGTKNAQSAGTATWGLKIS
jgi:hypothetical protein